MAVNAMQGVTEGLKTLVRTRNLTALMALAGRINTTCGLTLRYGNRILHSTKPTVLSEELDRRGFAVMNFTPVLQDVVAWFRGTTGREVDWSLAVEDLHAIKSRGVNLGRDLDQVAQIAGWLT